MKRMILSALPSATALLSLCALASASQIELTEASRSTHLVLIGVEAGFQDGHTIHESSHDESAEWNRELSHTLMDAGGQPMVRAEADHASDLSPNSIVFSLDGQTDTAGAQDFAAASVTHEHLIHFRLEAAARFNLRAHVDLSRGLGSGFVTLRNANDEAILTLNANSGGRVDRRGSGLLRAGDYVLEGALDLMTIGVRGARSAASGNTECEFVLHPLSAANLPAAQDPIRGLPASAMQPSDFALLPRRVLCMQARLDRQSPFRQASQLP